MKNLNVFGHQIGDAYRGVISMFSSVSNESKFESNGTLTPDEFILAGDQLVLKFPTWKWAPAADKTQEKSYLPKEKQFLITKGVPCLSRVRDLDHVLASTTTEDKEDGWLVAGVSSENPATSVSQNIPPPSLNIVDNYMGMNNLQAAPSEFADLDSMLLSESSNDKVTVAAVTVTRPPNEDRTRTYDLSITWDKYYQTPRLWLYGYNEAGQALSDEEIYQDVLTEYVTKTVTVDSHPATGIRTASIHPCQHAKMMLKVINEWRANGHPVRPDLSLFVFLKFISGVVPTINYDFTMDIDM
jgi:ubiquitin-like-conjugating enzyme ATG3